MIIKKAEDHSSTTEAIILLSKRWEEEGSCYGYCTNSLEDIKGEDIFISEKDGQIIGYLLCHIYIQPQASCTIPEGCKCLEIEELYVAPEYRSIGVGSQLYKFAVAHYGNSIEYVTLSTATKNYKAILHFYIEELGMSFWYSRLFKALDTE